MHVINTHYDDQGEKSRAEASLIIREAAYRLFSAFEKAEEAAGVVLMGDLSEFLTSHELADVDSEPDGGGYRNLTSFHPVPSRNPSFTFLDSYTHLRTRSPGDPSPLQSAPYGPIGTYTDFAKLGVDTDQRIDFIMIAADDRDQDKGGGHGRKAQARDGWEAVRYLCLDNCFEGKDASGWQGRWSDHRAVRVALKRSAQ